MARRGVKEAGTKIVPPVIERSIYVLASSLVLIALFAFWHPIAGDLWRVSERTLSVIFWALAGLGWAIILLSTFLINHFELSGLMQVYRHWRGHSAADPRRRHPLFYKLVRHPLYSGLLIAFWATPAMTPGHALLAFGMTVYVVIALRYEERDLVDVFGSNYTAWRRPECSFPDSASAARAASP